MSNVLSQNEYKSDDLRFVRDKRKIKIYDFKRPDKFTKEQIRSVCIIHESFARELTALLSGYFRKTIHVNVAAVDQLTYEEFIRSTPSPTTLAVMDIKAFNGKAVFEIDPATTHAMINRIFGGDGDYIKEQHELTLLEMKIMEDIFNDNVMKPLHNSWEKTVDLKADLIKLETFPQFCRIAPPVETVMLVTFECKFGEVEGMMNLCFPYETIAPILGKLTAEYQYTGIEKQRNNFRGNTLNKAINNIIVPVTVELGKKNLSLKDIKEIDEGTIIELDKLVGELVDIYAGDEFIGYGEVVVIDENFGVRVVEVTGAQNV